LLSLTAEALRAKIDLKSAVLLERDQFDPKFQVKGVAPPIIFARMSLIKLIIINDHFIFIYQQTGNMSCDMHVA